MSGSDQELRDHLVATLRAAPELPSDAHEHLADNFLEELRTRYQLVPRGSTSRREPWVPGLSQNRHVTIPHLPAVIPLLILLAVSFLLSAAFHLPFFVVALIVVFVVRFRGVGFHRRRVMRW